MKRFDPRRLLFEPEVLGLMVLGFLVKPVGLVSQVLMARWFGAGVDLDAYALAFFLVTLGDGALSRSFKASMAPHLIKLKRTLDEIRYHRYQNGVLGLFLAPGVLWLGLLAVAAPVVVSLVGPGLPEVTRELTIRMLVLMALPGLVMVANNLGIATLQMHQDFRIAGVMPVLNSLAMLVALILWHDRLGIWALPAGFALSQVLQWPLVHLRALRVRALRPVMPGGVGQDLVVLRAMVWMVLLAEIMLAVNTFLDKWFATGLEPGSISSLNYAWTLTSFGLMLFLTSLVTVMYPRMSEAIAAGDLAGCSEYIRSNLVRLAHLVVPVALAAAVASPELVRVLFERGAFDAADSVRTAAAMSMYLLGLPALIINGVIARIFHSLQLLRDKTWLALQYLATNAALNFLLVGPLQVKGLALASSLAINAHLGLSLWLLHRRRSGLASGSFARIVSEAYALGLLTVAVYWLLPLEDWTAALSGRGLVGVTGAGALKGVAVMGIYGLLLVIWRGLRRPRA
jgi:putative peptidoglycan lipid II flippase